MALTRYEQETIILYNEDESTASIETYRPSLIRQIDKLIDEYPDDIAIRDRQSDRIRVCVPKKWIKIRPQRKLSEAQLEQCRSNANRLRSFRASTDSDIEDDEVID